MMTLPQQARRRLPGPLPCRLPRWRCVEMLSIARRSRAHCRGSWVLPALAVVLVAAGSVAADRCESRGTRLHIPQYPG